MRVLNRYGLPEPFWRAAQAFVGNRPQRRVISATGLIDAPQIRMLRMRHWDELEEDCADRVWAIFGTLMHRVLEAAGRESRDDGRADLTPEQFLSVRIGDWTVTGRADLYEGRDLSVTDWKSSSAWAVRDGGRGEWERQLNVYAQLFRLNGHPVERLRVVAICRDWRESERDRDPEHYPEVSVVTLRIPVWSPEQCMAYIHERLRLHAAAEDGAEMSCSDEERWVRPSGYAVMKVGRKSALRVLDTEADAEEWLRANPQKGTIWVEERPASAARCERYCVVAPHCPQRRAELAVMRHAEELAQVPCEF